MLAALALIPGSPLAPLPLGGAPAALLPAVAVRLHCAFVAASAAAPAEVTARALLASGAWPVASPCSWERAAAGARRSAAAARPTSRGSIIVALKGPSPCTGRLSLPVALHSPAEPNQLLRNQSGARSMTLYLPASMKAA
jgi:hypothetical protein